MKYAVCKKCAKSVGMVNIMGNILMILIKGYMGVVGRSKGLIADAIHSSADLLATIIMIIGMKISENESDEKYPYGYGKAEYIVAILIYIFLFAIGVYIVYEGAISIIYKHAVNPCLTAAWGAFFSIAINELMFRQSVCAGTQINSPSMVAKAWESRSDVYSSIAVLIGILGVKMGFHFMDPLAAIIVGVIILKICIEMIKDSILNLMDKAPEDEVLDTVHKALGKITSISGIKNIFGREIGRYYEFQLDLYVNPNVTVSQGEEIKAEVKQALAGVVDRQLVIKVRLLTEKKGEYEET
ncbi:MAG: cation transporter [Desulfobacterales bacterium]|nr:cation transporter [Desulfobacterales bacterium]